MLSLRIFLKILRMIFIFSATILFSISCNSNNLNTADIVFLNGNIVTLNDSMLYAKAIALKDDTIQNVGSNQEIEKLIGENTEIIDLDGKFVMPGFVESHAHFLSLGNSMMILDLTTAVNWDDIIAKVVESAEKTSPGSWIVGRGWHQEKWNPIPEENVEGYPTHNLLSSATPFNPVLLYHASGHAIFANQKAMELAGIDTITTDPEGGKIVRDSLKNAVGVFEEEAEYLITKIYNDYLKTKSALEKKRLMKEKVKFAVDECLRYGITSFHDAGESFDVIDFLKEEVDSGNIDIRLNVMISADNNELEEKLSKYKIIDYGNDFFNVRSIKVYIDGALGSRGAWMFDEYNDLPGHAGFNVTPLQSLRKTAKLAIDNDFQMCTHAIGDKGNRVILDIYESTFQKHPDKKDLRWRIEHAQHLSPKDIMRFAQLGVIASMQGIHCTSDAVFVTKRLGDYRAKFGSYAWRDLLDNGAIICNGTDAPVEPINTINNFYASVTRKLPDGTVFYPDQKMTRLEALKSYTINGAYAAFQEDKLGTIEKGKFADIVVLSKDLLIVTDNEIPMTEVLMTIVGGKILYKKEH